MFHHSWHTTRLQRSSPALFRIGRGRTRLCTVTSDPWQKMAELLCIPDVTCSIRHCLR